jgi:internalin A
LQIGVVLDYFDKTILKNLDGDFITIYEDFLNEGIEYASQIKIGQIQISEAFEEEEQNTLVDFKMLELLSPHLRVISLDTIKNSINFESLYKLVNIEKMYIDKQKFILDISKFEKLNHYGGDYWKGLVGIEKSSSLKSLVLYKLPDVNLKRFSELSKLEGIGICNSKIQTLDGIQKLPIKRMTLAFNKSLEDIDALRSLNKLEILSIEKCKQIVNHEIIEELKGKIDINIIP